MASPQFASKLQEEVTCPICMDILQDPVTIDCGHNFCLRCITLSGKPSDNTVKCALCSKSVRRDTLRPNWLLMNLVEKIQAMGTSEILPEMKELRCQKHQEKYHYFCEHDGRFLCAVCRESKEHKLHKASLIEEAAQNYQGQIQSKIEALQQKEKAIVQVSTQGQQKINVFMSQVEFERQRVITEFKRLSQVLKEEKKFLLSRLTWLEQKGASGRDLFVTSMDTQLNSLNKLVDSLKAKKQKPPSELLWDIKVVLYRSDGFQFLNPVPVTLDLEKKLGEAKSRHDSITENMKKFKENLLADRKRDKGKFFKGMNENSLKSWYLLENSNPKKNNTSEPESPSPGGGNTQPVLPNSRPSTSFNPLFRASFAGKATPPVLLLARNRASYVEAPQSLACSENAGSIGAAQKEDLKMALTPVTLDAASAHPDLILSQDRKTVSLDCGLSGDSGQSTDPSRFYPFRCVQGLPGISCGRLAWEAEIRGVGGGACVVGVVSEHSPRQGFLVMEPMFGFWVLRITGSECQALTEMGTREDLPIRPRKVRVCADHERGEVVFYDATTSNHIYTFHASFPGRIFPFFRLLFAGTQVILSS
ncbi:E3 ubiquitin-protein ligase TRIM31 [Choloepus didactylus]|uniref:E3 ubiquitin-protein ligase TRIM31 n=1 Tax=Choloepus didactylus TaxID=27675 RepID=UPI00189CF8EC|nr:E3 ubiquitin-protein ligase TRIM31 [Choloepus didactylus]